MSGDEADRSHNYSNQSYMSDNWDLASDAERSPSSNTKRLGSDSDHPVQRNLSDASTDTYYSFQQPGSEHGPNDFSSPQTPNTARKPSLRFKLPESQSHDISMMSTPPTTASGSSLKFNTPQGHGFNNGNHSIHNSHNKFGSPFMDDNVIKEDEVYQSPKFRNFSNDTHTDVISNAGLDSIESGDVKHTFDNEETVTKRHRWGTTRNKVGRPRKEKVNRSKTLRKILRPSSHGHGAERSTSTIRKPSTAESGVDNYHSDSEEGDLSIENQDPKDPNDFKDQRRIIAFNRFLPEDMLDPETGKPLTKYPRNKIRTTKYTPLSFLPKNILNQFIHNIANVYFLAVIILGAFQIFGVPSPVLQAVPLICIVIITAIKDAIEDSRRTISDLELNNQTTHILRQVKHHGSDGSNNGYIYENNNVNDEKVSLWRRFKKLNSRLLFKGIDKGKENLTREGRARKMREKTAIKLGQDLEAQGASNRKSFDSEVGDFKESLGTENRLDPFGDDREFSNRPSMQDTRGRTLKFNRSYWKDVRVGDALRIYNNDEIPADVVILATSDDDNGCYVETKNLDGETNLKVKQALKYSSVEQEIKVADDLVSRDFFIESEGPHPNLYSYEGNMRYKSHAANEEGEEKQEAITINNLLLRGCTLRNTKWVIGIVVFTGSDTKIMLNAGVTPTKQSRISHELNYYVLLNFILMFIICFVSGIVNGFYYRHHPLSRDFYEFGTIAGSPPLNGLVSFFVAVILYQSLVPISLYITIEIIKTAQAYFIYSDVMMYYERLDYQCTPKSWSISDDLGQIEYIFSDKTGTLTQNLMEFKKCTINGVSYGRAYTEAFAGLRKRQGINVEAEGNRERELISKDRDVMVGTLETISDLRYASPNELTFISSDFAKDLKGAHGEAQKKSNEHFMLVLALCHSVITDIDPKDSTKLVLKAQSPDEAALVGTARSVGFEFEGSTKTGLVVNFQGEKKSYTVLNVLEFNSTRKRMSAIIKLPPENRGEEPRAMLLCKGADSIIYDRLSKTKNEKSMLETTSKHLEEYANEGLRTLCIAQRELTWSQYTEWNKRHQMAASSLDNREARMEEVADSVEQELVLLGGTAIEDRLQDGVPDSIALLAEAGMKLWVLTGDKVETAINIGFSCNLLDNEMKLLILKTDLQLPHKDLNSLSETEVVDRLISGHLRDIFGAEGSREELEEAVGDHSPPSKHYGVVIDGDALKIALADFDVRRKFLLLCKRCKAVLCCRVSPAQKAAVVKLVKESLDVMTLAIGDGSNDVAMIQAADVGVGIAGEEGRQAAMSSDYALGQFRFLVRLLLVHGRWSYKRLSEMVPSFFYKNVIFSIALFWYGIYNNFDGSYLFEYTYLMFYNLAFTSLPVIFLAVFDQDVSAKVSLLVPQLYRSGITRSEWTQEKFWWYMLDALYQSVISFFFPYLLYYKSFNSPTGIMMDHRFWMGVIVACISCIACNLYILFHQYRWDWLSSLIVAISILIVFGWTGIWTLSLASGEFYKAGSQLFGSAGFWACMFVGIVVCLLPRFFYDVIQRLYFPRDVDIIRECVLRGDFSAYPDNYDPTDPHRVKVSDYTSQVVNRISMTNMRLDSTVFDKDTDFNNSTEDSDEQKKFGSRDYDRFLYQPYNPHRSPTVGSTGGHVPSGPPSPTKSPPRSRSSIINLLKRRSNVSSSFYDNSNDFIDDYRVGGDNSLRTEEIPLDDFSANAEDMARYSRKSQQFSPKR